MKYIWIGVSLVTIVVIVYFISSKNNSYTTYPTNPIVPNETPPYPDQTPTSTPTPSQTYPTPSQTPFITYTPTPSQTPFFPTRPAPITIAPTAVPTTPAPTTQAPTAAPTTPAPTPINWTPYGATIFTSSTESSFKVGACDENGVQYRQTISGSPTLTEYMICSDRAGPTFGGIWDTCILRGINYGPVTITDQSQGNNPTIKAGTAITDANGTTKPFPVQWSTPTLIRNDSRNVQNCTIRAVDSNGNYAINDYIGQVVIYYNKGERVAIRIGTKGSNCYLSRNLNKSNQGYTTIGNIFNNITRSYSPIELNVVSDGSLY